jgi:hypothetical protein
MILLLWLCWKMWRELRASSAGPMEAKEAAGASAGMRALPMHVSQAIDGTVEGINAGLQSPKAGHGTLGKVAVLVDRAPAGEK